MWGRLKLDGEVALTKPEHALLHLPTGPDSVTEHIRNEALVGGPTSQKVFTLTQLNTPEVVERPDNLQLGFLKYKGTLYLECERSACASADNTI